MSEIFDQAPGVRVYVDDVLIWGAPKAEHDARLRNALQLASQAGLTFNPHKCKLALQEVCFLGDVISHSGIIPNTALSASLAEMQIPEDKATVHWMRGIANYFGKYIPNMADKTKLLRSLVKKDTVFEWRDNDRAEWKGISETLSSAPLLALFDANKEKKYAQMREKMGLEQHSCNVTVIAGVLPPTRHAL